MYKKEVADIEVYPNFFLYVGHDAEGEGKYEYSLHSSDTENTIREFIDRMRDNIAMIGFNNSGYDYPVIHYIMNNKRVITLLNAEEACKMIYEYSKNELIESEEKVWINPKEILVPQLDLYKIYHFDNMARICSLKHIEVAMRMENIEDLPYPPDMYITKEESLEVISYCHHDVKATKLFYMESLEAIDFRKRISDKYTHDMINYSDVKIGEYVNRRTYEELSGRKYWDFKKDRTFRKSINLWEVVEPEIKYQTKELIDFLNKLKVLSFKEGEADKTIDKILYFANNKFKFAKGGLHTDDQPRTVIPAKGNILQEKDVASYYPASIVNSKLYPQHLGIEWYNGVTGMFNRRTHEIKPLMKTIEYGSEEYMTLDTEQAAIKLSLNGGIFGKLGSVYSWQYDPLQKYRITINCQLKLLELTESLHLNGAIIHSANTDGVVIEYSPNIKDKIDKVHKDWENKYNYILEDTNYNRIFFSTVNDYLAEIIDDKGNVTKHKYKGDFEIDKEWHKDHSNRIVSIAIARKCLFDISPEETIKNHMYMTEYEDIGVKAYGIYDFCASVRARGDAKYQTRLWSKGEYIITDLPKTNRYFVSNNGVELLKVLPPNMNAKDNIAEHREQYPNQLDLFMFDDDVIERKERVSQVEAGQKVTMFNRYYEDDYDLNIKYYINECNKILNKL